MGYIHYEMEELLPIVAELAEKYTSKESTSVSYEKANQLMEAVLYCIHQCEDREGLLSKRGLPAREAYRLGCERLLKKVKKVQEAYNEMVVDFCAYGNENYQDTVIRGIYGFFRYYDALFAPQETIITMDYPTICPITGCSGIDAMESYVKAISLEQQFLHAIPQETVFKILQQYQADYHKQFYNICSIVLRHILVCLLIGKKPGMPREEQDDAMIAQAVKESSREQLKQYLSGMLKKLVESRYGDDDVLFTYLDCDMDELAFYLFEHGKKSRVLF